MKFGGFTNKQLNLVCDDAALSGASLPFLTCASCGFTCANLFFTSCGHVLCDRCSGLETDGERSDLQTMCCICNNTVSVMHVLVPENFVSLLRCSCSRCDSEMHVGNIKSHLMACGKRDVKMDKERYVIREECDLQTVADDTTGEPPSQQNLRMDEILLKMRRRQENFERDFTQATEQLKNEGIRKLSTLSAQQYKLEKALKSHNNRLMLNHKRMKGVIKKYYVGRQEAAKWLTSIQKREEDMLVKTEDLVTEAVNESSTNLFNDLVLKLRTVSPSEQVVRVGSITLGDQRYAFSNRSNISGYSFMVAAKFIRGQTTDSYGMHRSSGEYSLSLKFSLVSGSDRDVTYPIKKRISFKLYSEDMICIQERSFMTFKKETGTAVHDIFKRPYPYPSETHEYLNKCLHGFEKFASMSDNEASVYSAQNGRTLLVVVEMNDIK